MRNNPEHQEQVALMCWAAYSTGKHPELKLLFAIPNGGHRARKTGADLKLEGVKAGVPDICLPVARGGHHGLYIELKHGKNTATKEQKKWLYDLNEQGYLARVCWGMEEAKELIERYLRGCGG